MFTWTPPLYSEKFDRSFNWLVHITVKESGYSDLVLIDVIFEDVPNLHNEPCPCE